MGVDTRRKDLLRRARRRGGLLLPQDFREAGYGKNWAAMATRRGELVRLQPRVWAPAGVPDSRRLRIEAAAVAAGDNAAVSHATAAELHELQHLPRAVQQGIHISFPRGYRPAVQGVTPHFPQRLPPEHVTDVGRVRATTVGRTIADVADLLVPRTYERLVDAAFAEDRFDLDDMWALVAELGPFPGKPGLVEVLERLDPRVRGTRSDVERSFFRGLRASGVPLPTANVEVVDADGQTRFLDFAYVPERQPIEIDSDRFHGSTIARAADGSRQNAIVLTGEWRAPLRFDERDVLEDMARVALQVRRALDLARRNPLPSV